MAQFPVPVADSSALGNIAPLRASFLRHLHAENRSLSTRTTYAKAIDQLAAFLAASLSDGRAGGHRRQQRHDGFVVFRFLLAKLSSATFADLMLGHSPFGHGRAESQPACRMMSRAHRAAIDQRLGQRHVRISYTALDARVVSAPAPLVEP